MNGILNLIVADGVGVGVATGVAVGTGVAVETGLNSLKLQEEM
jgi:hypothetical protein